MKYRADLVRGVEHAASLKRRVSADVDERVSRALADGVSADPHALAARLPGVSYFSARRSLIRLQLWTGRTRT
jgi:hypothetical protein